MVAQEWSGSNFKNSVFFEPDEQGFDLFRTYLTSINQEPIRLLVDLIEEEFRQVTIPLIRGADRKAVINRHFEKFFRNSKFRHAFTQSVNKKKKRKEENLIFTGLTNPELLEPWLDVLKDSKTPLAGIISLPIISERFVEKLEKKNSCVILVSQQVPSNLRQTVFLDGKLILSRLVPIASFYQGKYAQDVIRDVDSTQRYLVSQRLIERSETVDVHILSNKRHFNKLTVACNESNFFDFEIHSIDELLKERKIDLYDDQDFSSALFCYEATKIRKIDHYARDEDKYYLKHYKVGLGLKLLGIALFSIGFGLGVTNTIQGYLYQDRTIEMDVLKNQYNVQFKELSEKTKFLPAKISDIKKAVDLSKAIKSNFGHNPQKFLTEISNDLILFSDIRVSHLNWFVAKNEDQNNISEVFWNGKKTKKRRGKRNSKFKGHYEIVILTGEFKKFNGNYRYALSVLSDLENLLKESGKYDEVIVLSRPINIGESSTLTGSAQEDDTTTLKRAEFKIKIIKKVPLNV